MNTLVNLTGENLGITVQCSHIFFSILWLSLAFFSKQRPAFFNYHKFNLPYAQRLNIMFLFVTTRF